MTTARRKVIQIVAVPGESAGSGTQDLYALCADGSIWILSDATTPWVQVDTTSMTDVKETFSV